MVGKGLEYQIENVVRENTLEDTICKSLWILDEGKVPSARRWKIEGSIATVAKQEFKMLME